MIVAIDGPAGSGKSTVAGKLANKLGFLHLNSGALYRAVAARAAAQGIALDDDEAISALAASIEFEFRVVESSPNHPETQLYLDGIPGDAAIFSASVGELASRVGELPKLRVVLSDVQRQIARGKSVVVEGRDAGTCVFPKAELKFYLEATLRIRAERRLRELQDKSPDLTLEQVEASLAKRDIRDQDREVAPVYAAEDAIRLDTSGLTVEQVVEKLAMEICKQ